MENIFDVKKYWDVRYKSQRDSGSGSYGRLSRFKAEVINSFIKEHALTELLELGCGDGNQLGLLDIAMYLGVDISQEALNICKEKYNNEEGKKFLTYTELYDLNQQFECVVSLDVIYHLSDDNLYYTYLKDLFTSAKKYVIVYANSTNYHCSGVDVNSGYVLFRDFVKDVDHLYKEFTLIDIISNEYPFSSLMPDDTSFADFYIFERNSEKTIDRDILINRFYLKKQLNRQSVLTEELTFIHENQKKIASLQQEKDVSLAALREKQIELVRMEENIKRLQQECGSYMSKIKYEQAMLVQVNKELSLIKKSRSYKVIVFGWRVKGRLRKVKNHVAKKLYVIFKNNRKIMSVFKKINKKFKIIKDTTLITGEKKVKPISTPDEVLCMPDIKVAVILDEFSYISFKDDFNALVLTPDNWQEVMEKENPDLFLCESAWSGVDSTVRPWKGKIYASTNWEYENRTTLIEILTFCKSKGIPTIFWNKEDPTHYTDKEHNFVSTAIMFDHIFTTAEECVDMYKNDHGHTSVFALPFATNPKMFNPLEVVPRSKDVVFAGSWYKQHPERCREMEMILDSILDNGFKIKIYNRHSEDNDPNHMFPEKYKSYIHKAVAFRDMPQVYKESEIALNINTVVQSKTMFARRVFELASSNTLILSNDFAGKEMFDNNIVIVDNHIDISRIDEYRQRNLEYVLKYHTYTQRFKQILDNIGYSYNDRYKKLQVLFYVKSFSDIEAIMQLDFCRDFEHSIVLSREIPTHTIKSYYETYGHIIKIFSEHYIKSYRPSISVEEKYVVLLEDFSLYKRLEQASLHTCYIPDNVGISLHPLSRKYTIMDGQSAINCIVSAVRLKDIIFDVNCKSKVVSV